MRVLGGTATEHGDHAAVAGLLTGLVHQPSAQRHQLEPGALVQRARGDQRGQLAERVTGHEIPLGAAEGAPSGDAGAEDRRLGEIGPLGDARERVFRHDLGHEIEQLGVGARDVVAHLVGLAPLPGKQDRGDAVLIQFQPTPHARGGYSAVGAFPPFGGRPQSDPRARLPGPTFVGGAAVGWRR